RLTVRLAQRNERFGLSWVALESCFVLADGGHSSDLLPSVRTQTNESFGELNMYLVRKDRRAGSPKTLSFYRVPLHLPVDADIHAPAVHPPRTPSPGRAHFGHCDMHMLPTHDAPAAQSAGPAQSVRHAPLAQAYGAQSIVIVIQAPLPLQVDAWFNVD